MNKITPGIKLKLIAHGLAIDSTRRDNLYAITYNFVESYSKHKNMEHLADNILEITNQTNELQFVCSSFDSILKKYYDSALSARSTLVSVLRQTIQSRYGKMTLSQAREYVYAFGDMLSSGAPLIGDATTLPCSRATLRNAFRVYFSWMNSERNKNPSLFEREGYGQTLRAAEKCCARIDDFHDILPADKQAVARANTVGTMHISDEVIALLGKYPPGGAKD